MRNLWLALVLLLPPVGLVVTALATPQFARQYNMDCSSCHVHVPKLNSFGELFLANGYTLPDSEVKATPPVSIWSSVLSQNYPNRPDRFKTVPNRIEIIAAGRSKSARMSYFIEWRALSQEFLSDMTVRDRSGRFEDLLVTFDVSEDAQLQVGQFRALSQIDVSRRLNLSEPLVFSSGLAGEPDPDPRIQSLRGFSPSGRSPSLRGSMEFGDWTGVLTVPFPGEFSLPLSQEARTAASFEFESEPKGVFVEAYRREGTASIGAHAFVGNNDRTLVGVAGQHQFGDLWLEGGIAYAEVGTASDWRFSFGADWIPCETVAAGLRMDYRDAPGQEPLFVPFISVFQQVGDQGFKLVFEGRIQQDRTPRWAVELGWMF